MDYQKIYNNLMKKRLENPPTEKFEQHHIVPRSLGGSDYDDNIVKLTYREHFIAHLLLCKIYKPRGGEDYKKMLFAINRMRISRDRSQIKSSRMFEYFREDYVKTVSEVTSKSQSGKGNSQYGASWYHHPELGMNATFKPGDKIPEGFVKGRKIKGSSGGAKELRELGIIQKLPQRKDERVPARRKICTCQYCGKEYDTAFHALGKFCKDCKSIHLQTNSSNCVAGRDYLTDEHIIELHVKFMESGLSIKQFQPQCGYNVTDNYLYSRWRRLGLQTFMNKGNKF